MSDLIICVRICGKLVDLNVVSSALRQAYRKAQRAVARLEKAENEFERIGQEILAEQASKMR